MYITTLEECCLRRYCGQFPTALQQHSYQVSQRHLIGSSSLDLRSGCLHVRVITRPQHTGGTL